MTRTGATVSIIVARRPFTLGACVFLGGGVSRTGCRGEVLDDGKDPGSSRQLIAALILLAALIAAGLWLTGVLRGSSAIQDCVQSGRTNCAPVH